MNYIRWDHSYLYIFTNDTKTVHKLVKYGFNIQKKKSYYTMKIPKDFQTLDKIVSCSSWEIV